MANISARETAYQHIRNRIIHLDLKPGEALSDKELAEQMGMSRTPVREAILMLSMVKLVVVRPQSGTYVTPIDLKVVEIEQFSRCALEKEMVGRICQALDPAHRRQYEENIQLYQFYAHSQLPSREEKLLETDSEFHRIAFQIQGKEPHFKNMLDTLHHTERFRILSLMVFQDDQVYHDHQQILQAIVRGDTRGAVEGMETHLNRYQENVHAVQKAFPQYFEAL